MVEVFPDRRGNVRNVEVLVKSAQDGTIVYKPSVGQKLRRHVNSLLVLVPVEDQVDEECSEGGVRDGELPQEEDGAPGFVRSSGGTVSLA